MAKLLQYTFWINRSAVNNPRAAMRIAIINGFSSSTAHPVCEFAYNYAYYLGKAVRLGQQL